MRRITCLFASIASFMLSSCGANSDDGVVDVAIIGAPDALFARGARLGLPAQHLRAATAQGLVGLDTAGQVVPAVAERWIVTDDGTSYIFRIREFDLPGGQRLTAQTVRDSLLDAFDRLDGTSMGIDLEKIRDIRAMTGRVVEIRLTSAMPDFLQMLAQPELGLSIAGSPVGPMSAVREENTAILNVLPPALRGLPEQPDWDAAVREVRVSAVSAEQAAEGFSQSIYDLVLGGTIANLPLVDAGPLSRGTIRLDFAIGLFGIDVRRSEGFLAQAGNREALSMALDRSALIQPFNIAGWVPTTRIVAPSLPGDSGQVPERWLDLSIAQRRAEAGRRVTNWRGRNGGTLALRIALPQGPGSDILFQGLAEQWGAIGVTLERAENRQDADLILRDRVARYGGARWFLNQFNCSVSRLVCSQDVDFLVDLGTESALQVEERSYLAEAETAFAAYNTYIPIGAPIRWSLVRADVEGFSENPWNLHPLFPLSRAPI